MNNPWSSNGRGGAAKQATTTVSDLGWSGWQRGKTSERSHVESRTNIIHEGHERHEENHVFFIHEGHERHEEKILRKIVMDSLSLPGGRCGAVVILLYPFSGIASIVLSSYVASSDINNI